MSKQVAALMVLLVLGGAVGIVVLMKAMTGTGAPIADNDAYQRLQRSVSSLEKELAGTEHGQGRHTAALGALVDAVEDVLSGDEDRGEDGR